MTREVPAIPDIPFVNQRAPRTGCELFTLRQLFARQLGHSLEEAQRVGFHLLMLITAGEGEHIVDFRAHPYRPGTLLCVAEGQVQQFRVQPANDAFLLLFTHEFLADPAMDTLSIFDPALGAPALLLSDAEYRRFAVLFREIARESALPERDAFRGQLLRHFLQIVLLRAERLRQADTPPAIWSHYHAFRRFGERVDADYVRTRNVADYAHALGVSAKSLNRLTRLTVGKSAKEFVDARVVLQIKRLLAYTDLAVGEIAARTGFDEPSNLVKYFKRHTHETPTAFRDAAR